MQKKSECNKFDMLIRRMSIIDLAYFFSKNQNIKKIKILNNKNTVLV